MADEYDPTNRSDEELAQDLSRMRAAFEARAAEAAEGGDIGGAEEYLYEYLARQADELSVRVESVHQATGGAASLEDMLELTNEIGRVSDDEPEAPGWMDGEDEES